MKCVAIGDVAVGKTCLLWTYAEEEFPEDYVPTTFDHYQKNVLVKDTYVGLQLWDTAGLEAQAEMRKMAYYDTDVFLVLFDISSRESFQHVESRWIPELRNCQQADLLVRSHADDAHAPSLSSASLL